MEKLNIYCSSIEEFMNQLIQAALDGYRPAESPVHFPFVTFDGRFCVELERSAAPKKVK